MGLPKLNTKISVEKNLQGNNFDPFSHKFSKGEVCRMAAGDHHDGFAEDCDPAPPAHRRHSNCEPLATGFESNARRNVSHYPHISVSRHKNQGDPHI